VRAELRSGQSGCSRSCCACAAPESRVPAGAVGARLLPALIQDAKVVSHALTASIGDRMTERTLILLRHAKSDWSGDEADIA